MAYSMPEFGADGQTYYDPDMALSQPIVYEDYLTNDVLSSEDQRLALGSIDPYPNSSYPIPTELSSPDVLFSNAQPLSTFPSAATELEYPGIALQSSCGILTLPGQQMSCPVMLPRGGDLEDLEARPSVAFVPISTMQPKSRRGQTSARSPTRTVRKTRSQQGPNTSGGSQKDSTSGIGGEDDNTVAKMKQSHSIAERRYRDNLSRSIVRLHHVLIDADAAGAQGDLQAQAPAGGAHSPRGQVYKSDILGNAIDYIDRSELEKRYMMDDIRRLKERGRALEKLIKCEDCIVLQSMARLRSMRI